MKKVLAVSGGIDSVVMLHIFRNDSEAVVAHYNHGIRPNSADDQAFVKRLAQKYKLPFETADGNLGPNTSEAAAREARYQFFEAICKKYRGRLHVAHHLDDVYESIVINVLRGTGWRGLAPLRNPNVERPLLGWRKSDIYRYATEHQLNFRQDQTNNEDIYLRNRVRVALLRASDAQKEQLRQLYERQCQISSEVQKILDRFVSEQGQSISRDIFIDIDEQSGVELLRELLSINGISQTRPQLHRALSAIKNYLPGKQFPLNKNNYIRVSKYHFSIKSN